MKRWLIAVALLLCISAPARAAVTCTDHVKSGTGGDDGGSNWANARETMMLDWGPVMGAGQIVCVSKDHAEATGATLTVTGNTAKGTLEPIVVICVDDADSDSLCGAGERATVTATGTNDVILDEKLYIYGVHFFAGDDIFLGNANADHDITLEQGRLELTGTSTNDKISLGTSVAQGIKIQLLDVDIDFAHAGQVLVSTHVDFLWDGGTLGFNVTHLFETGSRGSVTRVQNVDLAVCSGNLVRPSTFSVMQHVSFSRCKLHASVGLVDGTIDLPGALVTSQHCQSGSVVDPPYQMEQKHYQGTIQVSTTNVRTGGASDGTTTYAWELDADGSSYLEIFEPLCSTIPIARWVSGGSSITAKIHLAGPAGLDDTEAFIIWSIPPVGATSLGIRESSRALPGSSAGLTSEAGETWTSGTKYSISTEAFTPAENGLLLAWPCIAYDSGTDGNAWFDPKVIVE